MRRDVFGRPGYPRANTDSGLQYRAIWRGLQGLSHWGLRSAVPSPSLLAADARLLKLFGESDLARRLPGEMFQFADHMGLIIKTVLDDVVFRFGIGRHRGCRAHGTHLARQRFGGSPVQPLTAAFHLPERKPRVGDQDTQWRHWNRFEPGLYHASEQLEPVALRAIEGWVAVHVVGAIRLYSRRSVRAMNRRIVIIGIGRPIVWAAQENTGFGCPRGRDPVRIERCNLGRNQELLTGRLQQPPDVRPVNRRIGRCENAQIKLDILFKDGLTHPMYLRCRRPLMRRNHHRGCGGNTSFIK